MAEPTIKPITSSHRAIRTPKSYKFLDAASEALLYASLIFAPWAFGTTQPWSISVLNCAGLGMGVMHLGKRLIAWRTGYVPARWNESQHEVRSSEGHARLQRLTHSILIAAPLFLLVYCLVAALNASATYHHEQLGFTYHQFISWLPHSYDGAGTWRGFWNYLAMFCFFWATRDWLQGKTRREKQISSEKHHTPSKEALTPTPELPPPFPTRIQRLLWILCLNGAMLALVSILQRLDGTSKLLWMVESRTSVAGSHFGPYNYRSNAAQFFNLVWPVAFGLWWSLQHWHHKRLRLNPRLASGPHLLLLPVAILIAACPIISTSRGGALLGLAGLPMAMAVIYFTSHRSRHWRSILLLFLCLLGIGLYLGWAPLQKRLLAFQDISKDASSMERIDQYTKTWQMFKEYPVFGIGPNAYEAIYPLYRTPGQPWYPFAHNDWLQFSAEWGVAGFCVIILGLAVCLSVPWLGRPPRMPIAGLLLVSFLLVLAHAAFDFPFQVPSLLFTFVVLLSLYTCLPKKSHS